MRVQTGQILWLRNILILFRFAKNGWIHIFRKDAYLIGKKNWLKRGFAKNCARKERARFISSQVLQVGCANTSRARSDSKDGRVRLCDRPPWVVQGNRIWNSVNPDGERSVNEAASLVVLRSEFAGIFHERDSAVPNAIALMGGAQGVFEVGSLITGRG